MTLVDWLTLLGVVGLLILTLPMLVFITSLFFQGNRYDLEESTLPPIIKKILALMWHKENLSWIFLFGIPSGTLILLGGIQIISTLYEATRRLAHDISSYPVILQIANWMSVISFIIVVVGWFKDKKFEIKKIEKQYKKALEGYKKSLLDEKHRRELLELELSRQSKDNDFNGAAK